MRATLRKIERLKERYENRLLRLPNVVGVGIGVKVVNGIPARRMCLKVYVQKKIPKTQLRKKEVIPGALEGVKTDVEEIGRVESLGRRMEAQ